MMKVVKTIQEVREHRWQKNVQSLSWGLVPTMGALHEGHLSLVRQAQNENDRVAVSIFVNPKQFNRSDDLAAYPRPLDQDLALLAAENIDLVWIPTVEAMYPPTFQTSVTVENITRPLEGEVRPGHFAGVTTVVAKLFNVFAPTRAYFGQKDAQQVAVIRQMAQDLAFNLEVIVCPTVREADGLAMSSRNLLLSPTERQAATVLYRALEAARRLWEMDNAPAETLRQTMLTLLREEPLARVDYVSVANPLTLTELDGQCSHALVSMAVFIGNIRLIDNLLLEA